MAEYRTVRMDFWGDPYTETLPPEGKLLYLYLFTCPHTNNLGVLETTARRMAFETGMSESQVEGVLASLERDKKVIRDGCVVWLANFIKHQTTTSPKIIQSLVKIFPSVASEKIRQSIRSRYQKIEWPADTLSIPYPYHSDTIPIPPAKEEEEREEEDKERGGDSARARVASSVPESAENSPSPADDEMSSNSSFKFLERPDSTFPATDAEVVPHAQGRPKKTDCPSKGTPEWRAFLSCWQVYPVKKGQEEAWREWMRLKQNGTLALAWEIREAILRHVGEDSRWKRGKVPNMAKWLNGKGWNDEPYIEPEHSTAVVVRDEPPVARTQYQQQRQDQAGLAAAVLQADEVLTYGNKIGDRKRIGPTGNALPASADPC